MGRDSGEGLWGGTLGRDYGEELWGGTMGRDSGEGLWGSGTMEEGLWGEGLLLLLACAITRPGHSSRAMSSS